MADFDPGDIIRVGMKQVYNQAVDVVNVVHLQMGSGSGQAFSALSNAVDNWCDVYMQTIANVLTNLLVADSIAISNVTQQTVFGSIGWQAYAGGQGAVEPTATQVACLGFVRTALPRVQMRQYLGVFTEDAMVGGLWDPTIVTAVTTMMNHLRLSYSTGVFDITLQGVAYNEVLSRATLGVSSSASAIPVIQRRRRVGRGS